MPSGCCCPCAGALPSASPEGGPCGCSAWSMCCSLPRLPEIEEREDEDPDQVDEVPVQAHDLDDLVVALAAGEEARAPVLEVAAAHLDRHDDEEDHPYGHVRAVEARDHEEGRAELGGAPGVAPGPHAF